MKIEKLCEEHIKPSSPTPLKHRNHKISFIDEIIPHSSIPLILFYNKNETIPQSEICSHLKTSLSQILTQFYPLAGRMSSQYSIDCNDQGVYYAEVQVNVSLLDIIKNPKSNELVQLTPYNSDGTISNFQELLAIQVNLFTCGGIAISISISHKIGDASSLCTFIKNWCNTSEELRSNKKVINDSIFISLSSFFPPREIVHNSMSSEKCVAIQPVVEKLVVKRFIFTASNIVKMKTKVINSGYNKERVTRVEVITALLWKCFMAAKGCNSIAILPVNIRKKIVPPLPENSFGNFFLVSSAIGNVENEWFSLVGKIKNVIERIDGNYAEKIRGENGFEFVKSNFNQVGELLSQGDDIKVLRIGSWCNFPINGVNFGWGESILAIVAILGIKDHIVLLDSLKYSGGIEAWVVMSDQEMELFEQDKELQDFTSLDVSLL
ncbi:salutaridinol 7-O-acetyltransferase-like [Nicotiana tabacum]|uniref:Salutaridinol 7-O-acetyltransferase-like n=2 Tax=Nicotiana TaxID=4085 RepID=W8SI47_TOBAC|nr:salutaridinol 7-O-acetyltransferase-like [Nicotiana tabacum]XP_009759141.1 PREDICTED: salutaridinol 7-O-acetyltransferase-like [Nicotiana sylvestris]AHM22936.1 vinorine synthase [Nicotiana tabacum]